MGYCSGARLSHHQVSSHVLISPPSVPVPGEQEQVEDTVAARALRCGCLERCAMSTGASCVPRRFRRAVQRLETDLAEEISMKELASLAQMSRSHFAGMFKQLTCYATSIPCCKN